MAKARSLQPPELFRSGLEEATLTLACMLDLEKGGKLDVTPELRDLVVLTQRLSTRLLCRMANGVNVT